MEIHNEAELETLTNELFGLTKLIYTTQEQDERIDELTRAIQAYELEHYPIPDGAPTSKLNDEEQLALLLKFWNNRKGFPLPDAGPNDARRNNKEV